MKANKIVLLILFSLSAVESHAGADSKKHFRELLENTDYECKWDNGKPVVGEVNSDKVCLGVVSCIYLPKKENVEKKKDERILGGCKANDDGTCPEIKACEVRNDTETPQIQTTSAFSIGETKKESDAELGECEYDSLKGLPSGAILQKKDGFDMVCASPMKCSKGKPKLPLAICEIADFKVLKEKNATTGVVEDTYYPVCDPPVTCLRKGEKGMKFDLADVSRKAAKNSLTPFVFSGEL